MIGQTLAHYKILEKIGSGGMGEVWKAYDPKLQRTVAIKVLKNPTEDAATNILAEARAVSALNHPHICTIHDVGQTGTQSFIIMEYVEGRPLSELIPADGLPQETVIRYGLQIADALAHAHHHGIVHRDLKSANVVITPEAQVKLIDFGIAVSLSEADADAVTRTQASPVAPAGTLTYMAPEVLNGAEASARSDIWALGVLLYEMASGRLPFDGKTPLEVVSAIAKETPGALPARVPAGLRGIIQRCLQKEPGSRYSNLAFVQGALEATQSDAAVAQPPGIAIARRFTGWWLAAATVVAVAIGSRYWLQPKADSSVVPRLADPVQVTSAVGVEGRPDWSPDGRTLVYESNQSGNWDIWVTQVGAGPPVNRTAEFPTDERRPRWSPDGSQIAFTSSLQGPGCFIMSSLGGDTPRRVTTSAAGLVHGVAWSANGTELACSLDTSVEITNVQTGESRSLALPPSTGGGYDLSWSPDDRFLAYVDATTETDEVTRLWVVRAADGQAFPVTDGRWNDWSPHWARDRRALDFVSNRGGRMDLWRQSLTEAGTPAGRPEALTTAVGMQSAAWSQDAHRVAYATGGRVANVWRVPLLDDRVANWSHAEQLTFDQAFIEYIDVSSDGQYLVFSSNRGGNQDLWALSLEDRRLRPITTDPTPDWAPRWSPNGELLTFYAYRSGNRDIWVMPVAGGQARQLTSNEAVDVAPAWSPDGSRIAFHSFRSSPPTLWTLALDGSEEEERSIDTGGFAVFPIWSDGNSLLYWGSGRDGGSGIWQIDLGNGSQRLLVPFAPEALYEATVFTLEPGGHWLYFILDRSGTLAAMPMEGGNVRALAKLEDRPGHLGGYALTSDGKYLYFAWEEDLGDIWVMDVVTDESE